MRPRCRWCRVGLITMCVTTGGLVSGAGACIPCDVCEHCATGVEVNAEAGTFDADASSRFCDSARASFPDVIFCADFDDGSSPANCEASDKDRPQQEQDYPLTEGSRSVRLSILSGS